MSCNQCGKQYKKRASLLQHFRVKHLAKRTICPQCSKQFISTSTLNRHKRKVHDICSTITSNKSPSKINTPSNILSQSSFQTHNVFPFIANSFSLNENKEFGVHVVAETQIQAGEIVFVTKPFASIKYLIRTSEGCFECSKITQQKIQCLHCIDVWFCSTACKASRNHRIICDKRFKSSNCRMSRLAIEIIAIGIKEFGGIGPLYEFHRTSSSGNSLKHLLHLKLRELLNLKKETPPNGLNIVRYVTKFFEHMESVNEELKRKLFFLSSTVVNSLTLNSFSDERNCSAGGACVDYFIFDVFCRINHSCCPNINHVLDDDGFIECIATRTINAGEQIFIDYLPNEKFKKQQEKKECLKNTWHFHCDCTKCTALVTKME